MQLYFNTYIVRATNISRLCRFRDSVFPCQFQLFHTNLHQSPKILFIHAFLHSLLHSFFIIQISATCEPRSPSPLSSSPQVQVKCTLPSPVICFHWLDSHSCIIMNHYPVGYQFDIRFETTGVGYF